jgi:hypothetical protein
MPRAGGAVAAKALRDAVAPFATAMSRRAAVELSEYALSPFAHLDAGHVKILDLETLQEVELKPWDHQRELVEAWIDLEHLARLGFPVYRNTHEEKSRQMGITWIVAWVGLWTLTYHAVPGLFLHRRGAEVDDGGSASTPDSYFGKIRYMWERLPTRYQAPLQFRGHPESVIRNTSRPSAYLVGEGATPDPGRGGRYGYIAMDEAAIIPWGESVQAAVTRACPRGRLYNSTPRGKDNMYFRMKVEGGAELIRLRHHWSIHPTYSKGLHVSGEWSDTCVRCRGAQRALYEGRVVEGSNRVLDWDPYNLDRAHRFVGRLVSPWYDEAVVGLTDEQVAQELDIDYTGALTARVYPEWSPEVHVRPEGIERDSNLTPQLAWDYGADTTAVIVMQETPSELQVIAEYEVGGSTPEQVALGLREILLRRGVPELELRSQFTKDWVAVGDPAGEGTELATMRSLVADYSTQGFTIVSTRQPVSRTVNAVKRLLGGVPKRLYVDPEWCPFFIEHIENNTWPVDRQGRRKPGNQPLNDAHNHMMRALAYFVSYKWPAPEQLEPQVRLAPATGAAASGRIDPDLTYDMEF